MDTTKKTVSEKLSEFKTEIKKLNLDPKHELMLVVASMAYYAETTPPPFKNGMVGNQSNATPLTGKDLFDKYNELFEKLENEKINHHSTRP